MPAWGSCACDSSAWVDTGMPCACVKSRTGFGVLFVARRKRVICLCFKDAVHALLAQELRPIYTQTCVRDGGGRGQKERELLRTHNDNKRAHARRQERGKPLAACFSSRIRVVNKRNSSDAGDFYQHKHAKIYTRVFLVVPVDALSGCCFIWQHALSYYENGPHRSTCAWRSD